MNNTVNIFSGHDYTIVSTLASLGIIDGLPSGLGFSSYIVMELWDGPLLSVPATPSRSGAFFKEDGTIPTLSRFMSSVGLDPDSLPELPPGELSRENSSISMIGERESIEAFNDEDAKAILSSDDDIRAGSKDAKELAAAIARLEKLSSSDLDNTAGEKEDSKAAAVDRRILRIVLNCNPFISPLGSAVEKVCWKNEKVLAILSISDVFALIEKLESAVSDLDNERSPLRR
jgi:hypothetical protein